MQYLIAYKIPGEVAVWHKNLTKQLAEKFAIKDVSDSIAPHLTLKSPFSYHDIDEVKGLLADFATTCESAPIFYRGFGHFSERVIFLNVEASPPARKNVDNLSAKLSKPPNLSLREQDQEIVLHATLARAQNKNQFSKIMTYLKSKFSPDFESQFASVGLWRKKDGSWYLLDNFSFVA